MHLRSMEGYQLLVSVMNAALECDLVSEKLTEIKMRKYGLIAVYVREFHHGSNEGGITGSDYYR